MVRPRDQVRLLKTVLEARVTLAFAGDMHFQLHLAALLDQPRGALGPIARELAAADLTMVSLESAVTGRGTPDSKELEDPSRRFHFRTSPAAFDVLDAAGVDVVTMANNHGADYGRVGLEDTLRAARSGPITVVGIGRNQREAFTPYRVSVRGTDLAIFAADASKRESESSVWAAGPSNPGIAAARASRPRALLAAVHAASQLNDAVVVYLHWGAEYKGCPTGQQRTMARALVEAGADIIVGSHAHVLLGSGWMGGAYVNYGLGNFLWYHDHQPESGVLLLRIRDGAVVDDSWIPAMIQKFGRPLPLTGSPRATAVADWRRLRSCAALASRPRPMVSHDPLGLSATDSRPRDRIEQPTPYSATVRPIGPALRDRMRFSRGPGCPVPWRDLRHLRMTYVGYDLRPHIGEMVIHKVFASGVTEVFEQLYDARWPIRQMRLVDDYRGDDNLSMAANNTSGFNCRRVAGSDAWSAHAYGAAIDINPVQNPYVTGSSTAPPAGRRFTAIDRSPGARVPTGAIRAGDVVVRAFARIGWEWGGDWSTSKDYQHFSRERPQLLPERALIPSWG